jgi:hypothetical protein
MNYKRLRDQVARLADVLHATTLEGVFKSSPQAAVLGQSRRAGGWPSVTRRNAGIIRV